MNTPQEFAELLAALRGLPAGGGAALATLTRTSGSTFRRAGARMLVLGDGRIVRGLSAGCPEQDIAARARQVIETGRARLLRYNRQQGYDTLLEMGCGGELDILIEPLRNANDWHFAEVVDQTLQARRSGVLATLFARDGLTLSRPLRWLWSDGLLFDDIADPGLTAPWSEQLPTLPAQHKPSVIPLTTAGGTADVLIERLLPPCAALLFGANASSLALARVLTQLGWIVSVIDHREAAAGSQSGVHQVQCAPQRVADTLHFDSRTFAVVMTHNLERDIAYLRALRDAPLAYLGAVGARRRAERLFEATGLSAAQLRTPAGLDIGSETPEEIAIAIAAEMLSVANGTGGGALNATHAPIHR